MKINIHRYCNKVALSVGEQATQYLSQELAAQLAATLQEAVLDIAHREFTASQFESRELVECGKSPKARLHHHVTGAIERGEAVAIEAQELPWHVVAVSTDHVSFGHKSVLFLREDGERCKVLLQAYGTTPLPCVGDTLKHLPSSEVPPRKLPACTPSKARQIISTLK